MKFSKLRSAHSFHIPVMGTGFSLDSPLRIARYGISSVISLVDDLLMDQIRKYHCDRLGLPFEEISRKDEDGRAKRITTYLNFLDELIRDQVKELQSSPFEPGSEITRYFELLPESSLKESYSAMLAESDSGKKVRLQDTLRCQAVPGTIDVNIMTKVDREHYSNGEKLPPETADAMSAFRGYAQSSVRSAIVFSAGINPRLYGYIAKFEDFFPNDKGALRKKIILKVSDFRSATIQGKYLAKRGLWISEYRIESGLNCGGHAFATEGGLMGPILDEFGRKKTELIDQLHKAYNKALGNMDRALVETPHDVRITVQGGIGTADENKFLLEHYGVDGTGWGTPFLLVPEVTNIDDAHLQKLSVAGDADVYLSDRSPLGVPFWSLRTSGSEDAVRQRVSTNKPGSKCPKSFLLSDTEFTKFPICRASRSYQKRKLEQIAESDASSRQRDYDRETVLAKSCICHDLGGSATLKLGIDTDACPEICCGPNIVNFSKVASLEEMVGHIYGRLSIMSNSDRPHMFIKELSLYVDFFRNELQKASEELLIKTTKYFLNFKHNLTSAVEYYRGLAEQLSADQRERFQRDLEALFQEIEKALPEPVTAISPEATS